ncbi:MAG: hypothetical protein AAF697_03560 [Pseudomonadota bacterium]
MDEEFSEGGINKPGWIKDPDTGQLLPIEKDSAYREALVEFYDRECSHEHSEPMALIISDGRKQVYRCCTECGERIGSAMSQKDKAWVDSLPTESLALSERYTDRRNQERHEIMLRLARQQFSERGRFTKAYRDYLESDDWRKRRELILKRCGGVCEGCGIEPATEVHHLSYEHFMEEFLFELVGLCHSCHERCHLDEAH